MKRFSLPVLVLLVFTILLSACATTQSVKQLDVKVAALEKSTQDLQTQLDAKVASLTKSTEELQKSTESLQAQLAQLNEMKQKIDALSAQLNEMSIDKQDFEAIKGTITDLQTKINGIIYETMAKIAEVLSTEAQTQLQPAK